MKCTWVGCEQEAKHPQVAADGLQWANLCDEHFKELENDIEQYNAKRIISDWIKANGGAKALAKRIM